MGLIRIDRHPPRRQLCLFGALWLVFFGVLGGMVLHGGSTALAGVLWALAAAVPAIGWMVPSFMRIVYLGMAYASFPIGLVISHLILAIVYYLVFTPVGLAMRWFGYDPMNRRFDRSAETYWCRREQDDSLERYFRQV